MRITEKKIAEKTELLRALGFNVREDFAYNQVRIVEECAGGAIRELSGFGSNKDVWEFMSGMIATMTLLNKKREGIVQHVMLGIPIKPLWHDRITTSTITHVVGCYSRGRILAECQSVDQAQDILDGIPKLNDDGYCIYTKEEWNQCR